MTALLADDVVHADDLVVGTTIVLGTHRPSKAEIVAFAREWDPQGFHVDEDVAARGAFGGIIASGLHSMAIFQRLAVDGALGRWAVIAGRSIEDVQMTRPVRPDMELRADLTIAAVEPKGPERALVSQVCRLTHEGEPVLTFRGTFYMRRRPGTD